MTDRPLMMVSLPNSGSTWLAGLIAKHLPGCRYYDKEFFNPVCNLAHEDVLRRNFGSELVSCYRNIAWRGDGNIDADIAATWGKENYTFTKECQSAFKLPVFVRHFECFVLLRRVADVFPPSRLRVWSFYEHAWFALVEAGHPLHEVTTIERSKEACTYMQARLHMDAKRHGVPVIWLHDLLARDMDGVRSLIAGAIGADLPSLAEEIVATRRDKKIAA